MSVTNFFNFQIFILKLSTNDTGLCHEKHHFELLKTHWVLPEKTQTPSMEEIQITPPLSGHPERSQNDLKLQYIFLVTLIVVISVEIISIERVCLNFPKISPLL